MMETPRSWIGESDRAVSPVIGVILMVAITVILAAVIGTFVLELGQGAGEKAPDMSVSFADDDDPYAAGGTSERMFRIKIQGLSDRVTVADLELRIIEPNGNTHTFLGQNADFTDVGGMDLTVNGGTLNAGDEIGVGDTLIIAENSDDPLADNTDYTLQFVFTGGEDPKVIAEGEVRLQ